MMPYPSESATRAAVDETRASAVLAIGGTDSSGGAGLTRDADVLAECGVAAPIAVTAVTVQSDERVIDVLAMPARLVREQVRAAFATHDIRAVKIGMVGTRDVVEAIADTLPPRADVPIVLDPVLAASSGGPLLDERGLAALRELLLPRARLLTPNVPEAAILLGEPEAEDEAGITAQALRLCAYGPRAVLVKGGHARGAECVDVLANADGETERLASPRLPIPMRGTGCALASAIAAGLARGMPVADACRFGKALLDARRAGATSPAASGDTRRDPRFPAR